MGATAWAFWIVGWAVCILAASTVLWALLADRARGRRRCPKCWYDLSATPASLACPECGRTAPSERHLARTRRRWGRAAAAALLLPVGIGLIATPAVRARGWTSLVPTTALILMVPYMDGDPRWYSEAMYQRTGTAPIPRWQRRLLFNRCGAVLRSETATSDAKFKALRRIEGIAWRGGYNGGPTREATDAAPVLIRTIADAHDPRVRAFAAGLLPTIGGDPPALVAALARAAGEDEDGGVRLAAIRALYPLRAHASPALDAVIAASRFTGTDYLQRDAVSLLGLLPAETAPRSLPVLTEALRSPALEVRRAASGSLGKLGPAAAPAVPALLACGGDEDFVVVRDAAISLRSIGVRSPDVRTTLFGWLGHPEAQVRQHSLVTIDVLFGDQPETPPEIRAWLGQREARDAADAVAIMAHARRDVRPYAPWLVPMLSDTGKAGWERRFEGARYLCLCGYTGQDALEPARSLVVTEPISRVRVWGALLAAQVEGDRARAVDSLVAMLSDPSSNTRGDAAEALGLIGPPAAAAIPALEPLLAEQAWAPRENAKKAIKAIRGEAEGDETRN